MRRARPFMVAAAIGGAVGLVSFLAGGGDHAGEPFAVAAIAPAAPIAVGSIPPARSQEGQDPKGTLTATEVEDKSGVTVVRQGGGGAPGSLIISVPQGDGTVTLAPAPDPRLVERDRFGLLPRIGTGGERPAKVYARPVVTASANRPRIAVVIGGLGLDGPTTANATARLPGEVSLAFAPYGQNLKGQIDKAREGGHEVLLQVPMEPFDYPNNNPGPETLTVGAGAKRNIESLHWAMARTMGFVGIENFLGARFTSDEAALTPVLKDIAGRGLIFIDDGSSARSIAPALAESLDLPARRADVVIDAAPNAAAIDAALAKLEATAREKGLAVASGSALPITIERLSAWASGLAARGIDLVPVTATVDLRAKG